MALGIDGMVPPGPQPGSTFAGGSFGRTRRVKAPKTHRYPSAMPVTPAAPAPTPYPQYGYPQYGYPQYGYQQGMGLMQPGGTPSPADGTQPPAGGDINRPAVMPPWYDYSIGRPGSYPYPPGMWKGWKGNGRRMFRPPGMHPGFENRMDRIMQRYAPQTPPQ